MNRFLVLLAVVVFAVLAVMIIGKQYSAPDVSYPYSGVIVYTFEQDAWYPQPPPDSYPDGSVLVLVPPRP